MMPTVRTPPATQSQHLCIFDSGSSLVAVAVSGRAIPCVPQSELFRMLTQQFPFLDPATITIDLAERLHRLARDGARLAQLSLVPPAQLQAAPLLDSYRPIVTSLGVRLVGHVTGHPELGTRDVVTSQLWWADPNGAWVRTLSRYYRLGAPAPANDDAGDVSIVPGYPFGGASRH
jgi:hypothetical protein